MLAIIAALGCWLLVSFIGMLFWRHEAHRYRRNCELMLEEMLRAESQHARNVAVGRVDLARYAQAAHNAQRAPHGGGWN